MSSWFARSSCCSADRELSAIADGPELIEPIYSRARRKGERRTKEGAQSGEGPRATSGLLTGRSVGTRICRISSSPNLPATRGARPYRYVFQSILDAPESAHSLLRSPRYFGIMVNRAALPGHGSRCRSRASRHEHAALRIYAHAVREATNSPECHGGGPTRNGRGPLEQTAAVYGSQWPLGAQKWPKCCTTVESGGQVTRKPA
jgi:hypothetical protein